MKQLWLGMAVPRAGRRCLRSAARDAMDADREGPRLAGVYGRKAGSVTGFAYSPGLKNSGITWTDATLERWLTDPDRVVKDNNMSIGFRRRRSGGI